MRVCCRCGPACGPVTEPKDRAGAEPRGVNPELAIWCEFFTLEDLFAAGLGFEIAGACLLALGLLASPRQIADAMDLWHGGNSYWGLAAIDDRINGGAGLLFLGIGFLLQAVGYAAIVARPLPEQPGGWQEAVGALAFLALGFCLAAVSARAWRRRRRMRSVVDVSRYDQRPHKRMPYPLEWRLSGFAEALDAPAQENENRLAHFQRLFGIDDFYAGEGEPSYWLESEAVKHGSSDKAEQYMADEVGEGVTGEGRFDALLRRIFEGAAA